MPLYLLTRNDSVGYDEYDRALVRAANGARARQIAHEQCSASNGAFIDSLRSTMVEIPVEGPEVVIIDSFCAG